jgi:hypothetical protein
MKVLLLTSRGQARLELVWETARINLAEPHEIRVADFVRIAYLRLPVTLIFHHHYSCAAAVYPAVRAGTNWQSPLNGFLDQSCQPEQLASFGRRVVEKSSKDVERGEPVLPTIVSLSLLTATTDATHEQQPRSS